MSIWPNAFQALSLVEPRLKQQINSIGAVITRTIVYSSSGEPPKENNRLGLLTMIRWDRLLEILDSYLPPDSIHYQHQVVGIEPGVDRVTVHLKDKPSLTSKFLVAADGLWSKIRPIILSEHPKNLHKPRFEGQGFWVGLLPPGSQASQLACQLCPTGEGRLFDKGVVFLFDCGENFRYWRIRLPLSILKEYDPKWDSFVNKHSQGIRTTHGGSEIKERLLILSKARKWPSELHEFFTAIDENLICERGIFVHNVAPRWSLPGFNIVLLGDAAHATSPIGGQGGAMAFEDGAILASLLGKIFSNSQIPDSQQYQSVIASYEKQRMHRATLVQMLNNVQGRRSFFGGQDESAPEANHPLVKEWLAKPQAYRQWQQTFLFDANC
ncbi:MAG: FAD-dependent monooxygenase [Prochloraceae cyanobacterium]